MESLATSVAAFSDADLVSALRRRGDDLALSLAHQAAAERLWQHRAAAVNLTRMFLEGLEVPAGLRALYLRGLEQVRPQTELAPCLPPLDFPVAVYASLDRDHAPALPLSVAGLLYYVGIGLFDDVIDDDLDEEWTAEPVHQINLAAVSMCTALPLLAVRDLCPGSLGEAALARMASALHDAQQLAVVGEFLDIGTRIGPGSSLAESERIVELKTGSTGAMLAEMAGAMASATHAVTAVHARLCRLLFMSMQIASDVMDVWGKPISPDLANGVATLPLIHAFHALRGTERERFRRMLSAGDRSPSGQAAMRRIIEGTGSLRYCLSRAESYRQRAIECLREARPRDAGADMLGYLLEVARIHP